MLDQLPEGPRVAICAIAKNEADYLAEWAIYHRLIGFSPIRVYNHESSDDSAEVLKALETAGIVEWTDWTAPPKQKPQWVAYENGLEKLSDRTDWIAFIDLDEFIVIPDHDSIQAFLADHSDLEALAINWKMFGSAGHEKQEPGFVIDRFNRCAKRSFRGNRAIKTLARVDAVEVPRVHTCTFRDGVKYETVLGEEIPPSTGKSKDVSHSMIRINHYFTRSREEWDAKARRGRGAKPANHPLKHRTEEEFHANDRNEREELEIQAHSPKIAEVLEDLGIPRR